MSSDVTIDATLEAVYHLSFSSYTTKVNYDAIASRAVIQPIVESEDFGESLNGHGETGNGPDADVEHFPTTEKKGSLSYADAARGTKRYVSFE